MQRIVTNEKRVVADSKKRKPNRSALPMGNHVQEESTPAFSANVKSH